MSGAGCAEPASRSCRSFTAVAHCAARCAAVDARGRPAARGRGLCRGGHPHGWVGQRGALHVFCIQDTARSPGFSRGGEPNTGEDPHRATRAACPGGPLEDWRAFQGGHEVWRVGGGRLWWGCHGGGPTRHGEGGLRGGPGGWELELAAAPAGGRGAKRAAPRDQVCEGTAASPRDKGGRQIPHRQACKSAAVFTDHRLTAPPRSAGGKGREW
mmetsp:Transcript_2931/g.8772  ORF Transcript_2931/g.8772 Transcript_2931/m.8772 type:complete len:213 (+) Transcript_2931:360-998(+)